MSSDPDKWERLKSGNAIRGSETLFTDDFAKRLGYAFALWLARRLDTTPDLLKIAVGHDPRDSGPRLKAALICGLTAADCDVLDCGLSSTPAVFSTTLNAGADGAVMITASHQPPGINGFKFHTRNGGASEADVAELLAGAARARVPVRLVVRHDALDAYLSSLRDVVRLRLDDDAPKPLLGLHVVVDAGNGSGGFYADFLEDLGAWVEGSQFLDPDGQFPNHAPNPESPEAMRALSKAVVKNEADLGVLFDADCDRAAVVLSDGRLVNKNRLIALTAAMLLSETPNQTIVTDSVTSSGLTRFISEWGGTHYRFKRGYRNVINEAVRLNDEGIDCPLAIETSGHAAFRDNHFLDDGMYLVTLLICKAMDLKREGKTLYALLDGLQEPVESTELRLAIRDEDDARQAAQDVIETVLSHTLEDPSWRLAPDNREGVRICFDFGGEVDSAWFQMRMSLHDPVMALNLESDVPGGVAWMLSNLEALLADCEQIDLAPLLAALSKKEK